MAGLDPATQPRRVCGASESSRLTHSAAHTNQPIPDCSSQPIPSSTCDSISSAKFRAESPLNVTEFLKLHERFCGVYFCKSPYETFAMLPDSSAKVVRYPDIQCAVSLTCEDVNEVGFVIKSGRRKDLLAARTRRRWVAGSAPGHDKLISHHCNFFRTP
jgi:hypothetical protein